jgi:hypothetical protein
MYGVILKRGGKMKEVVFGQHKIKRRLMKNSMLI